jgi:uncharacterized SAM-dependent methyltransferase
VYQIGEVQARSWMLDGTSVGNFTPDASASYVGQRGIGTSSIRK